MIPTLTTTIESPIGPLLLRASRGALTGVQMQNQRHFRELPEGAVHDDAWFADIAAQFDAYFSGDLREFDVTLDLVGATSGHPLRRDDFVRRVGRSGRQRTCQSRRRLGERKESGVDHRSVSSGHRRRRLTHWLRRRTRAKDVAPGSRDGVASRTLDSYQTLRRNVHVDRCYIFVHGNGRGVH